MHVACCLQQPMLASVTQLTHGTHTKLPQHSSALCQDIRHVLSKGQLTLCGPLSKPLEDCQHLPRLCQLLLHCCQLLLQLLNDIDVLLLDRLQASVGDAEARRVGTCTKQEHSRTGSLKVVKQST